MLVPTVLASTALRRLTVMLSVVALSDMNTCLGIVASRPASPHRQAARPGRVARRPRVFDAEWALSTRNGLSARTVDVAQRGWQVCRVHDGQRRDGAREHDVEPPQPGPLIRLVGG